MKTIIKLTIPVVLLAACLSLSAQVGSTAEPTVVPAQEGRPASRPADPEAAADALIKQLLMDKPSRPIPQAAPSDAPPADTQPTVAPREIVKPIPMPPGSIVTDRLGRLVKDPNGAFWTFHFESEKNVLREPPIQLLPNRLLEYMEETSANGSRAGVKFRVSGEVTEYRGAKYMLLRKVLVERDMGAL